MRPNNSTTKRTGDRSRIDLAESHAVRCWTRHLGVSRTDLEQAVEKVGNSAAAVRKQLASGARSADATATVAAGGATMTPNPAGAPAPAKPVVQL
jgi:hypothetical protein